MEERKPFSLAPSVVPVSADQLKNADTVNMWFPHPVSLSVDHHNRLSFKTGVNRVPVNLQHHPYLVAHGVKHIENPPPAVPDFGNNVKLEPQTPSTDPALPVKDAPAPHDPPTVASEAAEDESELNLDIDDINSDHKSENVKTYKNANKTANTNKNDGGKNDKKGK